MTRTPGIEAPVGIFDSGVGGLTVVKAVRALLSEEHLVYLGDTARTPYGSKARETVTRFSLECVDHLLQHGIKALVVACNTASAFALPALRRRLSIPVLGVIQPGARAALAASADGPIGVIGTRATIHSHAYLRAIRRIDARRRVHSAPCPLLVPLVEEGWLDSPVTQRVIETYLAPLRRGGIRSLILGCTHYPAVKPMLARVCGPRVRIIDSAEEVAKELDHTLARRRLRRIRGKGTARYFVTDVPEPFVRVGTFILGRKLSGVRRVALTEGSRV